MDPTLTRVWQLAAPLAEGEGMEIVDIGFGTREAAAGEC